jgi:hypothetical protein
MGQCVDAEDPLVRADRRPSRRPRVQNRRRNFSLGGRFDESIVEWKFLGDNEWTLFEGSDKRAAGSVRTRARSRRPVLRLPMTAFRVLMLPEAAIGIEKC